MLLTGIVLGVLATLALVAVASVVAVWLAFMMSGE